MRLLITGANGFVGRTLVQTLLASSDYQLNLVTRNKSYVNEDEKISHFYIDDIATQNDWTPMLSDCDVVIHTAARVHILKENCQDPLSEFRRINVAATMNLAKQAAEQGVKRFIFLSSIGVHGTAPMEKPISEESDFNPTTPYAISKFEVENALFELAKTTDMEVVTIRPPLVHAEDAAGNFGKLLSLVNSNLVLPLASIKNQRSFIFKENLVDFICCCINHPNAKNQAFVIADEGTISTPELITQLKTGMGLSKKMLPFPAGMVRLICKVLGKEATFQQLCGSLQVNAQKARNLLGWNPKFDLRQSLLEVGVRYKKKRL